MKEENKELDLSKKPSARALKMPVFKIVIVASSCWGKLECAGAVANKPTKEIERVVRLISDQWGHP